MTRSWVELVDEKTAMACAIGGNRRFVPVTGSHGDLGGASDTR